MPAVLTVSSWNLQNRKYFGECHFNLSYIAYIYIFFGNNFGTLYFLTHQPLWRFMETHPDGRLLVYRSEDIKNISRLASPKVCGYVNAKAQDLLPEKARVEVEEEEDGGGEWTAKYCTLWMGVCYCIKVHGFAFIISVP